MQQLYILTSNFNNFTHFAQFYALLIPSTPLHSNRLDSTQSGPTGFRSGHWSLVAAATGSKKTFYIFFLAIHHNNVQLVPISYIVALKANFYAIVFFKMPLCVVALRLGTITMYYLAAVYFSAGAGCVYN